MLALSLSSQRGGMHRTLLSAVGTFSRLAVLAALYAAVERARVAAAAVVFLYAGEANRRSSSEILSERTVMLLCERLRLAPKVTTG